MNNNMPQKLHKKIKHVEVLVAYTVPEEWNSVQRTKTATQDNRFANADYIAFLRVGLKDKYGRHLPSSITHIAKVKDICPEKSIKIFFQRNPELLEFSQEKGKGWENKETHKEYYLEEIEELPRPIPYDGKPKCQVCFYTTLEELEKAKVLSDIKTVSQIEKKTHIEKRPGRDKSVPKIRSNLISPEDPYRNKYVCINVLKSCSKYICWIDRYFSKVGLQYLSQFIEEMENGQFERIYVITASNNKGIDKFFMEDYELLQKTTENKGISLQIRVIDKYKSRRVHDRFIINERAAYNVPSTDTIKIGDVGEVSESQNREYLVKTFQDLWKRSEDLETAYKKIANYREFH